MTQNDNRKTSYSVYSLLFHLMSIFFMCLGSAGVIVMAASVPEIDFSSSALITASCIVITALYLSNYFAKPLLYAVLTSIVVFCVFFILSDREIFLSQWQYLFGGFIPESGAQDGDVGRVALVLAIFFSLLLFYIHINP